MDFDKVDAKTNERFAVMHATIEQNADLKSAAESLGRTDIVKGGRGEDGRFEWRLYQDRIPAGVDVDATFGKYTTPEAVEARRAQNEQYEASKGTAREATKGPEIEDSKRFYPHAAIRREFDALRKSENVQIDYEKNLGYFVQKSADIDADKFAKFQTPEAKTQWKAEEGMSQADRKRLMGNAVDAIDVVSARAEGKQFLADNSKGFALVSERSDKGLRDSQLEQMKAASDPEVAQVHTVTRNALRELENKELRIRMGVVGRASREAGVEFDTKAFLEKSKDDQRKAAGNAGLKDDDFAKMVALKNGYFAVRQEAIDRGLIAGKGQAQASKKEQGQSEAIGAKSASKEVEQNGVADEQKKAARGSKFAAVLGEGLGR